MYATELGRSASNTACDAKEGFRSARGNYNLISRRRQYLFVNLYLAHNTLFDLANDTSVFWGQAFLAVWKATPVVALVFFLIL